MWSKGAMIQKRANKRPRGRPSLGKDALPPPITLRLPPAMLQAIDELASSRLDQPDRSALIRELLAEALARRCRRSS
ncbi:MAG TPA: ribbon-helix-helix protein, CopG family [Planctomycetes bacterium]|nr:ribbon-helix-helix protein, CopG family [Planctomycetota bacterium]